MSGAAGVTKTGTQAKQSKFSSLKPQDLSHHSICLPIPPRVSQNAIKLKLFVFTLPAVCSKRPLLMLSVCSTVSIALRSGLFNSSRSFRDMSTLQLPCLIFYAALNSPIGLIWWCTALHARGTNTLSFALKTEVSVLLEQATSNSYSNLQTVLRDSK